MWLRNGHRACLQNRLEYSLGRLLMVIDGAVVSTAMSWLAEPLLPMLLVTDAVML